jgi:8-oxo-dGTP pyrophosphatase MutT (NUDIX family)
MDWMIGESDPARLEIVRRAVALGITGTPSQASHVLGEITLADGRKVRAHVVHAIDPIITDGDSVVLINRKHPPRQGMPALPGGFMDPTQGGGIETAIQAAAREAMEEVGISLGEGKLIGMRNMNRPHDVRIATNTGGPSGQQALDELYRKYGIREGDIFMVSTQAVRFDVPNLKQTNLNAGDDALPGSARRVLVASLTREMFGITDHYDMIMQAFQPARADGKLWADTSGNKSTDPTDAIRR